MKNIKFIVLACLISATACFSSKIKQEEGYVQVNGVALFYRIVGEGEPFILLHGGPGMYHDELYPFFLGFAEKHKVIFYDQRGNGRSLLDTIDSTNFTVDLLVDDLEQLRKEFGIDKLNIIGHSWGGLLGMYYAVKYPEKVKRLITVSSAPVNTDLLIQCYQKQVGMFSAEQWAYLQKLWESEGYLAGDHAVHNEAMRLSEGVLFFDQANVDKYMAAASFNSVTARNAVALNDLARGMKLNIQIQDDLSRIQCPTLIIHCADDFIVPAAPQLANDLIANSELVILENSGHYPHIEIPEQFFATLERFIEKTK